MENRKEIIEPHFNSPLGLKGAMAQVLSMCLIGSSGNQFHPNQYFKSNKKIDLNPDRANKLNIDVSELNKSNRKSDKYGKGKGSKKLSKSKRKK